jgi:4'-phosphopantetheinyl transferase
MREHAATEERTATVPLKCQWPRTPGRFALSSNEVHVWCTTLHISACDLRRLRSMLSPDEIGRAERYYRRVDRDWFIARRGQLREMLGRYLGTDPAELPFAYSAHGKPMLESRGGRPSISFNLSHSHGLALYAVSSKQPVGIDLEHVRDDIQSEQIAAHAFSAEERGALMTLSASQRQAGFFRCWTRKEAYIKATGQGLSRSLDDFAVSLAPDEPARLLVDRSVPTAVQRWWLYDLCPAPGFAAALAVEACDRPVIICRRW